jgi:transcriptional/translational regulatory protein YebC/TACO1
MRDMGRIFEVRKHAMFARWNRMAKQFTRIAKDIAIAVHTGGPIRPRTRRCAACCKTPAR